MTEWTVVVVIISLAGLIATVAAPIIKLNKTIASMNTLLEVLSKDHDRDIKRNSESHARLWKKNEEQDDKLENHEKRLTTIEVKGGKAT